MLSWSWKPQWKIYFFHVHVFQTNSASYEYKNTFRSADNGTQLVSMEIPNIKKKIEVVNQKLGHPFNTHFRVIVCIIRMVFNKTVFQMTVDKVSKSTWSIYFQKAVVNDVKKPGL